MMPRDRDYLGVGSLAELLDDAGGSEGPGGLPRGEGGLGHGLGQLRHQVLEAGGGLVVLQPCIGEQGQLELQTNLREVV